MQEFDVFKYKISCQKLLISANAGSGKTFAMIWAALRLIIEEKVPADKIVIITFTEKAANQLLQKIQLTAHRSIEYLGRYFDKTQLLPAEIAYLDKVSSKDAMRLKDVDKIFVGTIHSFAKKCLSLDILTSKLFKKVNIDALSNKILTKAAQHIWRKYNTKLYAKILPSPEYIEGLFLKIYNYQNITLPKKTSKLDSLNPDEIMLSEFTYILLKELMDTYQALKNRYNHFDFRDLITKLLVILKNPQNQLLPKIKKAYQVVIVDEFQDTDAEQLEVIKKIFDDEAKHLILVGDPKQSIYAFRGADLGVYLEVQESMAEEEKFKLSTNYRSTDDLIQALNFIFTENQNPFLDSRIKYFKSQIIKKNSFDATSVKKFTKPFKIIQIKPEVRLTKKDAYKNINHALVDQIKTLINEHQITKPQSEDRLDIAVLVGKNDEVKKVQKTLRNFGIECSLEEASKQAVLSSEAYYHINCLLRLFESRIDEQLPLLNNILASKLIGLDVKALKSLQNDDDYQVIQRLFSKAGLVYKARGIVAALILINQSPNIKHWQSQCSNAYHYSEDFDYTQKMHLILNGIEQYELKYLSNNTASALASLDEKLVKLITQHEKIESPGIKVMTYHKAKGLEFSDVILPFLWSQNITPKKQEGFVIKQNDAWVYKIEPGPADLAAKINQDKQEQRRVIYTAFTRAKHRLILMVPNYANRARTQKVSDLELLLSNEKAKKAGEIFSYIAKICQKSPLLFETEVFNQFNFQKIYKNQNNKPSSKLSLLSSDQLNIAQNFLSLNFEQELANDFFWLKNEPTSFTAIKAKTNQKNTPKASLGYNGHQDKKTQDVQKTDFPNSRTTGIFFHNLLYNWDFKEFEAKNFKDNITLNQRLNIYFSFLSENEQKILAKTAKDTLIALNNISIAPNYTTAFCLKDVEQKNIIKEWQFFASNKDLKIEELAENLTLTGSVDMLFKHQGYYYIIDWKTGKLDEYGSQSLKDDVIKNSYDTQAKIYFLAVKNHLEKITKNQAEVQPIKNNFVIYLRGLMQQKGLYYLNFA